MVTNGQPAFIWGKNVETGSGSCECMAKSLNENLLIPVRVIGRPIVSTPEEIYRSLRGSKQPIFLYWCNRLDAYIFARENVD